MDAGLLDVLHDGSDQHLARMVADRVDVDLDGVLEEPVDEHGAHRRVRALVTERGWRRPGRGSRRRRRSPSPARRARSSAARAPDSRSARRSRAPRPPRRRCRRPAGGSRGWRRAPTTARGPRPRRSPRGLVPSTSAGGSRPASLSGVWPPRPTITPATPPAPPADSAVDDVENRLLGDRLEVQPVGGVVVGRDGLGVAVDHDRLVARPPAAPSRRARSSSRTRSPGRSGSGPSPRMTTRGASPGRTSSSSS